MYVCTYLCLNECMLYAYEYFQIPEEELHPLELKLQVIERCFTCVLGIKLSTSGKTTFLNAEPSLHILPF